MLAECVLVTEKEFAKAKQIFAGQQDFDIYCAPTEEQPLADMVLAKNCRAVILGVESYSGPLYEALGKVGQDAGAIIARFVIVTDGIDKNFIRKHNIILTNTQGVLDISVAEHTIWLMGALTRHVAKLDAQLKSGKFVAATGNELHGKTMGIIGFGAIGRRVAAMAHFGFGMKVLAADVRPVDELSKQEGKPFDQIKAIYGLSSYTNDIHAVLRESNVVSVHLLSNDQTFNFFDAQRFTKLKRGAFFVNTSRGSLVDEEALYDALSSGHLAGAGLDVYAHEPYEPMSPDKDLRKLGNVVLTPHVASNTVESNTRMAKACLRNIANFFSDRTDALTRADI